MQVSHTYSIPIPRQARPCRFLHIGTLLPSVILSDERSEESKFCGAKQREAEQNRKRNEWQRAAGSANKFLNVCLALVTFLQRAVEDAYPYKMLFLQADMSETVSRSRSALPYVALAVLLRSVAISQIIAKYHSALQNFDSVVHALPRSG